MVLLPVLCNMFLLRAALQPSNGDFFLIGLSVTYE